MPYKKIFVPIDDSRASMMALKEAIKIAKLAKADIFLAHVIDLAQFSWGSAAYVQGAGDLSKETHEIGDKVLAHAKELLDAEDIQYEFCILQTIGDKIANLLIKSAADNNCDLVVMGTHGWTGVMHLLMGSVAEGVLRQSIIPVMMVRQPKDNDD
jgi:nucleotide-binding universal stress UspA family protein